MSYAVTYPSGYDSFTWQPRASEQRLLSEVYVGDEHPIDRVDRMNAQSGPGGFSYNLMFYAREPAGPA